MLLWVFAMSRSVFLEGSRDLCAPSLGFRAHGFRGINSLQVFLRIYVGHKFTEGLSRTTRHRTQAQHPQVSLLS